MQTLRPREGKGLNQSQGQASSLQAPVALPRCPEVGLGSGSSLLEADVVLVGQAGGGGGAGP